MSGDDPRPPQPKRRGYLWPAQEDGRWIKIRERQRFWSKHGTVLIGDLGQFDMTEEIARHMTTHHLHYYPHVCTGDKPGHAIALAEIRRREGWVPRTALMISAVALILSFISVLRSFR